MRNARRTFIRIISGLYILNFCIFIFLINHPALHNISVDLNYSDIQEYITSNETDAPLQSGQHLHDYTELPEKICFVCVMLSASFDYPTVDVYWSLLTLEEPAPPIQEDKFIFSCDETPLNPRAPPVV